MKSLCRDRGLWLGVVVLIMFVISLAQGSISYTMTFGPLRRFLPRGASVSVPVLVAVRFSLVAAMAALWILRRKHALLRLIILTNAMFTVALLGHASGLVAVLPRQPSTR